MSSSSGTPKMGGDRLRIPPVALAIGFAALVGAALILISGHDPLSAYAEIAKGSLSPAALPDTLNWATPLVGMTLAAAIPLRGGMVNLGGDGQIVIGGLIGALTPLYLPGPGAFDAALGLALAGLGGGLYSALAAWGEVRHGVPMLISSLLLGYPAIGVTSYLARFPLRDVSTGLPQTLMVLPDARLYVLSGALNVGSLLIAAIALAVVFVEWRTSAGYELRMRGKNPRFARYGGVRLGPQAVRAMFASGAIAGLVGAIVVLGSQFRFIDGALITPAYTWSGLMAALLVSG